MSVNFRIRRTLVSHFDLRFFCQLWKCKAALNTANCRRSMNCFSSLLLFHDRAIISILQQKRAKRNNSYLCSGFRAVFLVCRGLVKILFLKEYFYFSKIPNYHYCRIWTITSEFWSTWDLFSRIMVRRNYFFIFNITVI